jgi:heat shock protein HtpX
LIAILIAVAIILISGGISTLIRFALSRSREYLADAGAVELTKNPDAMIGALRKVSGHSELAAPAQVREMFLDHPRAAGLAGLFATHPAIDDRIAALVRFGGGHDRPPPAGAAGGDGSPPGPWSPTRG